MNRTARHLALGASTGLTVFAVVVPLIHLLAEVITYTGFDLGTWDNPVEVFVFAVTASVIGAFPWGLWILLTDARTANMFDEGHEAAEYLIAAMSVFLILILLVCTRLQPVYAQHRWLLTPTLLLCAAVCLWWRWRHVWRFPPGAGVGGAIRHSLALPGRGDGTGSSSKT